MKKVYKNKKEKILRFVKVTLFISMLVLIYMVSPRITQLIQDLAKYLYELESIEITRVVELILSITFIVVIFTAKSDKN